MNVKIGDNFPKQSTKPGRGPSKMASADSTIAAAKRQIEATDDAIFAAEANIAASKAVMTKTHEQVAADTERYEALAREHGADLSEEAFNAALKRVRSKTPS